MRWLVGLVFVVVGGAVALFSFRHQLFGDELGAHCIHPDNCKSGQCLTAKSGHGVCVSDCSGSGQCDAPFECRTLVAGSGALGMVEKEQSLCLKPGAGTLGDDCTKVTDCASLSCLVTIDPLGTSGSTGFCTEPCADDGSCPNGAVCAPTGDGRQCAPADRIDDARNFYRVFGL